VPARGFYTDEELCAQIQATLSLDAVDANWKRIAAAANRAAYADIVRAFAARGYSRAQIDAWEDAAAYQADQALFWALVRGGATKDYDSRLLKELDRREDLKTVGITTGGVLVAPALSATGAGAMDTTADLFSLGDDEMQSWYDAGQGPLNPPAPRW
jgi:hypothetical protein